MTVTARLSAEHPRSLQPHRRWIPWAVWLSVGALSAAGLRHYRVDNDLASWTPETQAVGPHQSYAVIGADPREVNLIQLADELRHQPSVAFCIDPAVVRRTAWLTAVSPEDFVIGDEGRYAGVFVFRKGDAADDALLADIDAGLTALDVARDRVAVAGPAAFHVAMNRASQQRLPVVMLLIVPVGILMLRWVTGTWRQALTGVAAVTLSQIILIGLLSWRRVPMDMSLSMVPPLMMALGYSYAAHRSLRRNTGGVLLLCMLTTAMGFATFAFTDLTPIRSFAAYSVLGLLLVWGTTTTMMPAPAPRGYGALRRRPFLRRPSRMFWSAICSHPARIVGVASLITVAGLICATRMRFEADPLHYFPADDPLVRDFAILDERLTGMLPFQVHVDGRADAAPLLRETPGIRKVIDVTAMVNAPGRTWWCLADNNSLARLRTAQPRWADWASRNHVAIEWRGVAAQLDHVASHMTRTALWSLPVMGIVAAVAVGLVAPRWTAAGASLWVNLLPIPVLAIVVASCGWSLGLPSLMIGAISMGVAVDDTLHLTSCYGKRGSLRRAFLECWRPCVGSSLIAAMCLLCFAISPFGPVRQFGVLLSAALFAAMLSDSLLLPVLLSSTFALLEG